MGGPPKRNDLGMTCPVPHARKMCPVLLDGIALGCTQLRTAAFSSAHGCVLGPLVLGSASLSGLWRTAALRSCSGPPCFLYVPQAR